MMNKIVRKKSYKTMSVAELVAARKELLDKTYQIDCILNTAVEAVKGNKTSLYNNSNTFVKNSDPAFEPRYVENTQVSVSNEAPVLPRVASNSPDQSSGFSIFDAESYATQQSQLESKEVSDHVDFDFNSTEVSQEIETLKKNISDLSSN